MDLKERDKYRDVLKKAAPDLRKYLAIDDGLLVEFAAVDVISLEEKEIIQNPQLTYHQKVDKLLEFIRLKIHIAFFPFMELLKEKDKQLHKHVLTFISEDNSGNSLPELVDQLDIKTKVNKPSPDSSCKKKAIVKKDAAPRWKQSGLFNTGDFDYLRGLAINQDGDIVLASCNKGVKVYSRIGKVKCTLYTYTGATDVAVTHDNKYVTNPYGKECITFHDSLGKQLSTVPIKDVKNRPSIVYSVAIDTKGRIIVGQGMNTISIHNPDGSVISKFATESEPLRLAITSNDEIVTSSYDETLEFYTVTEGFSVQMMGYTGGNIRVIQPPPDVTEWSPGFVCCRQGEIFVANKDRGTPTGVYQFTSEGEYLGCVTTDVTNPAGIALSEDGNELFVADRGDKTVNIFQRP